MTAEIALVFVAGNEGEVLLRALDSLFESSPSRTFEIVVVDNASTDGTKEDLAAEWPAVRVLVRERRYGLPANLNHGIRATTTPYVMLCNPDLVFTPGAVDALASFLDEHPKAAIAAPKLLSPEREIRTSARRWYTLPVLLALRGPWRRLAFGWGPVKRNVYADWDYLEARPVDWVPCSATMLRRAALDEVGLMDERFHLYFDDVDISLRMHEAGFQVWCVPQAEIVHLEQRSSVRPLSRAWWWHLESMIKFYWKHKGLRPRRRLAA